MQLKYKVHSAAPEKVTVEADYNGAKVTALVEGYVVELVSEDGRHSHTLRALAGDDAAELASKFKPGDVVTGTFAAE